MEGAASHQCAVGVEPRMLQAIFLSTFFIRASFARWRA